MNKNKLPDITNFIIENYLLPIFPRASYETLALIVFFNISKILCYNRVTIDNDDLMLNETYPNLYTISFSQSGSGKDKAIKSMKSIMKFFEIESKEAFSKYVKNKKQEIENHIKEANLNGTKAVEYRKENAPRWLKMNIDSNSTVEGFMEQRKAFEDAKIGCTHWMDSEIYDTIRSKASNAVLFKKANKEAFDHGDNQDKVIKGNKEPCDVERVPHLINLHGAIDSDEQTNIFKQFFDLGYARRCFVFMNEKDTEFTKFTREEKKAMSDKAKRNKEDCEKFLKDIYERTKQQTQYIYGGTKVFKLSDEAVNLYFDYEEDCKEKAFNVSGVNTTGISIEIEGRPWKMVKLSAIIAVQESSEFIITKEHLEKAIYLTDYYGEYFKKFYSLENITIEERLIDFIKQNPKCTKTTIRKQKFMPYQQYAQTALLKQLLDDGGIEEALSENGEMLVINKGGSKNNATYYSIIKTPENLEAIKTGLEMDHEILLVDTFGKEEVEIVKSIING